MRKFLGVVLALLLVLQVGVVTAAADGGEYTYTVRIFAGNRGKIDGDQTVYVFPNQKLGSTITFVADETASSRVHADDSRYFVRGIRLSGHDNGGRNNDSALQPQTILVTGDVDYVVAYGIRGQLVTYTVNYQAADGTTLRDSMTYYGNVGEQPVIAYLYIDGYQPQAYNLTKTLSANEAENVFTFVYTPLVVETPGEEVVDNGVAGGGGADGAGAGAGADGAADGGAALADIPDDETPLTEPAELINLDEDDTPLAGFESRSIKEPNADAKLIWSVSILVAAIAAMSGSLWFLLKKRKNQEEEDAAEGAET